MIETQAASARDRNRLLSRFEFETGATMLQSQPRALFIELTRHCNLSCLMCRGPGLIPSTQRMSEKLFSTIEAELFPTADMIDLRGWGESLILPEFPDRARRAARYGATLRVLSNLSFHRDEVLDLVADMGFHLGISIDSADPQLLAQLRGGACLDLIERNLYRLSASYERTGISDRLSFYVTCQRPALPGLERLVELAARTGIRDVRLAPVGTRNQLLSIASATSEVEAALTRILEAADRTGVRVSFTASLVDDLLPNQDAAACLHPWTWCYVAYHGLVGFCDHLIAVDRYTFGNLTEQPFRDIWNCPEWRALRREHLDQRRQSAPHFHECAWCYKNRHVDCEDLVESRYAMNRLTIQRAAAALAPKVG